MIPFSFARERQFSAISARLLSRLFVASSEDTEKLILLTLEAETGVFNAELFDDANERRLSGVYGVERALIGVSGERS